MHRRPPVRFLVVSLVLGASIAFTSHQGASAQSALLVVASGLDNPRGLRFGPGNALYVVEAGRGGSGPCIPQPDAPPGTVRCYGPTGAVTRVTGVGAQQRVVTGLPSFAVNGVQATGPHDIDFALGRGWITIGLAGDPAIREPLVSSGIRLGSLVRVQPSGAWDYVVDIAAHEAAVNPAGGTVDTNPYGLRVFDDRAVVADAGANALLQVNLNATISTLTVFPSRDQATPFGSTVPMQSVPTAVEEGPDGNLYVGELTGFPFPAGGARVYRIPRNGGAPQVVASGFTNVIDIAFDRQGRGYVLEFDSDGLLGPGETGRLVRVDANGLQTVISSTLIRPGGVAVGPDGALYVTTRSIFPGLGEVVRIAP
jgi:hypothetical protein